MHPTEARAQLLREHEQLRSLLARAVALAEQFRVGTAMAAELRQAVDDLRVSFAAHNQSEEALLVPILEEHGAIGPARIARMIEEHTAEHASMRAALAGHPADVAARLDELAEDIDAHMAAEERTFLSVGVLRP